MFLNSTASELDSEVFYVHKTMTKDQLKQQIAKNPNTSYVPVTEIIDIWNPDTKVVICERGYIF
jgi:hypothetical protein